MDHAVGAGAAGEMPEFVTRFSSNEPHRNNGIYVIRFPKRYRRTPALALYPRLWLPGWRGHEFPF
jgi:hypothetical protein